MIEYLLMTCKEQVFAYYISSQAPVFFLLPSSYATKSFSFYQIVFILSSNITYPSLKCLTAKFSLFLLLSVSPLLNPPKNASTIRASLTYMMRHQFVVSSGTTRGTTSHWY